MNSIALQRHAVPAPYPASMGRADRATFSALTEPYRRELQAHCYRIVGSTLEAEDLVQETFLRAWRHRETYAARASIRAWLYRIATNVCLDALAQRPRRTVPALRAKSAAPRDPLPAPIHEPIWLEPFPDDLLAAEEESPEARYSMRETITLAFMTWLQVLPPRQRAVLILRDVLDWHASEVAETLGVSVPAIKSALHRARSTLNQYAQANRIEDVAVNGADTTQSEQLNRYVRAWETADVDALAGLLVADATFSMPPTPAWYRGRENIREFVSNTVFAGDAARRWRLKQTRANGQPAFAVYQRADDGYHAYGIQVVTFGHMGIADIITFRNPELVAAFGMPARVE